MCESTGSLDLWAIKQNYRVDFYNNEISGIFSYKQAMKKNLLNFIMHLNNVKLVIKNLAYQLGFKRFIQVYLL